jgi:hypothetical protein
MFQSLSRSAPATQVDPLRAFVKEIGLTVREAPLPAAPFLPGLLIEKGELVVDRRRRRYAGDILHEVGHVAVTAAAERPALGDSITEHHPEKEGKKMTVLAWTYAACRYLQLPPKWCFILPATKTRASG